jgi:hypothetical protein
MSRIPPIPPQSDIAVYSILWEGLLLIGTYTIRVGLELSRNLTQGSVIQGKADYLA